MRRWLADHDAIDGLILEPRSTLQIFDTYLDTDDWRIHRAGFALRVRSESGKSEVRLESLHSASASAADRRELRESLGNAECESIRHSMGPVGARVQAVSGARDLLPLFELRTSRQRFAIRREDEAEQLGEIALDETVVSRPRGEPRTSMQRVAVEALTEVHQPLESLVKTLRSACALEPAADTQYAHGLESVGLAPGPAPDFAPTMVDASMPIVEVALANLRSHLSAWYRHEPGARLGDDPEELHCLRVAGRRMDAILRQFRSCLPAALLRTRAPLRKVLRALGDARDFDVALIGLERFGQGLPESEMASVEPLRRHLLLERGRARVRMLRVLDSVAVQKSLQKLTSLLAAPSMAVQQSAPHGALNLAPDFIRRRYRKVRKSTAVLGPDSSMEAYHELRCQVKKLRYALEVVAALYGKPADEALRALRRWQEKLGMQQDASVASRRLKLLAATPPKGIPSDTLFLMGRLSEHYTSIAVRARKQSLKGYRKVSRRWKRLRSKFEVSGVNDARVNPAKQ